jgi:hypothetical protein
MFNPMTATAQPFDGQPIVSRIAEKVMSFRLAWFIALAAALGFCMALLLPVAFSVWVFHSVTLIDNVVLRLLFLSPHGWIIPLIGAFFGPNYTSVQKNQRNLLNQQGGNLFGEAGNIYNQIDPALQNILSSPGYTPQQVSDLTAGTLSPISSGYSSAAANLGRIGARTNNTAGIVSGQDELARQGAAAMGTAGANLSTQIADRPRDQTFKALSGLQNLYNPTLSEGGNLYGQATNIANNPKAPSIAQNIGTTLGLIGSAAGVAAGMPSFGGGNSNFGAPGTGSTPLGPGYGSGQMPSSVYGTGGTVKKKKPVIVGDRGPEVFVPGRNGRIIPNPNTVRQMESIYG